jgi:hypothetical protein
MPKFPSNNDIDDRLSSVEEGRDEFAINSTSQMFSRAQPSYDYLVPGEVYVTHVWNIPLTPDPEWSVNRTGQIKQGENFTVLDTKKDPSKVVRFWVKVMTAENDMGWMRFDMESLSTFIKVT